jgi:hypothetical protein
MTLKVLPAALLAAALLISREAAVLAQSGKTPVADGNSRLAANISGEGLMGRVLTPSGKPVAYAAVLVQSLDNPAPAVPGLAVTTGADGRYFWPLPPGHWEITVAAPSGAQQRKTVTIGKSKSAILDFTLAP